MWVARDKYGSLHLFKEKPDRCDKVGGNFPGDKITSITPCVWRIKNPYGSFYDTWGFIEVDSSLFPNLKWEDEPIEVFLSVFNPDDTKYCIELFTKDEEVQTEKTRTNETDEVEKNDLLITLNDIETEYKIRQ